MGTTRVKAGVCAPSRAFKKQCIGVIPRERELAKIDGLEGSSWVHTLCHLLFVLRAMVTAAWMLALGL